MLTGSLRGRQQAGLEREERGEHRGRTNSRKQRIRSWQLLLQTGGSTCSCWELSLRLSSLLRASSSICALFFFSTCSLCFRFATFLFWSFTCLVMEKWRQSFHVCIGVGVYLHALCSKEYLDGNEMFLMHILFNNSIFSIYEYRKQTIHNNAAVFQWKGILVHTIKLQNKRKAQEGVKW